MYYADHSLGLTMVVVAFWSLFVPMGCGATYGARRRGVRCAERLLSSPCRAQARAQAAAPRAPPRRLFQPAPGPRLCPSAGIAPFITRRGLGVATGLIGAGGNTGSAVTQALFFTSTSMSVAEG